MPKQYPEEFVEAVKAAFPDWERLHQALDNNDGFVGRYLDDSRGDIPAQTVLDKIEIGDIPALQRLAERQICVAKLYGKWCDIWHPVPV